MGRTEPGTGRHCFFRETPVQQRDKIHTIEEQIGGQLEAGLMLTHIYGDTNGEGRLHEMNIECYYATRSVKP